MPTSPVAGPPLVPLAERENGNGVVAVQAVTKRYDEPIEVTPAPFDEAPPVAFRWRGRNYQVAELLSEWRETSEAWDPKKVKDREYHRVLARPSSITGDLDPEGFLQRAPGAVYDVYRDRVRGGWRIARVWD